MKKLICFAIMVFLSLNIYAQKPLKIASVNRNFDNIILDFTYSDSTLYFYDKEGVMRTAIHYNRESNSSDWEKYSMNINPETGDNTSLRIDFTWNKALNDWEKREKWIGKTTENPHTAISENYLWYTYKNCWMPDHRYININDSANHIKITQTWNAGWNDDSWQKYTETTEQEFYNSKNKKILFEKKTCSACGTPEEIKEEEKQVYDYDNNDSLVKISYYIKKNDSANFTLTRKQVYAYNINNDVVTVIVETTTYTGKDSSVSRSLGRSQLGRLVSNIQDNFYNGNHSSTMYDSFTYNNGGNIVLHIAKQINYPDKKYNQIIKDSSGYDSDKNKVFHENLTYDSTMKCLYGNRYFYSYSGGKNTVTETHIWDTTKNVWKKLRKVVLGEGVNNLWSVYENYNWDESIMNWQLNNSYYTKYNSYGDYTEVGTYYAQTKDSAWWQRNYYQETVPKYHALNGDLSFVLSPNPSNGHVNANVYTEEPDDLHIIMVDMFGRFVFEKKWHVPIGVSQIKLLENNQLLSGVYLYYLSNKNSDIVRKGKLIITK